MIGCRRDVHLLIHTLAFALQLRKITENIQVISGRGGKNGIVKSPDWKVAATVASQ
jgi:hypothetical protein